MGDPRNIFGYVITQLCQDVEQSLSRGYLIPKVVKVRETRVKPCECKTALFILSFCAGERESENLSKLSYELYNPRGRGVEIDPAPKWPSIAGDSSGPERLQCPREMSKILS